MIEHKIEEGLIVDLNKLTSPSDASDGPGSEELYYLVSTTAVLNMVIDGASQMLDKLLPDGYITVGTHLELTHTHPTLVGEPINIRIKVAKIENCRIFLDVEGNDSVGRFFSGKYERHIVNKIKLMQSAYERFPESMKQP